MLIFAKTMLDILALYCRRSCTIALAHPKKVGTSWKGVLFNILDTHRLHHLKHDLGIFTFVMPNPDSMHCNLPSVLVLAFGCEVVCKLGKQALATWTN